MFVSRKVSSEVSLRHFLGASVLIDSSHGLASLTLLCQPHYAGIRVRKIYLAFFCQGWGGSVVTPLGNGHKTDLWYLMAEVIPQSTGAFSLCLRCLKVLMRLSCRETTAFLTETALVGFYAQ